MINIFHNIFWTLYIWASFNGEPHLEMIEYSTESECLEEKSRVTSELLEVYGIDNAQIFCIRTIKSSEAGENV